MTSKIYLDASCLNRPFDDQSQERIRLEAEAVLLILARFERGELDWVGSEVLQFEIDQIPDVERSSRVRMLLNEVQHTVLLENSVVNRGRQLQKMGFEAMDALHLASAEFGKAGVFLTTDDQIIRVAGRRSGQLHIEVRSPLTWLREAAGK
jgi:predicted nucleic acid-binding protein